MPDLPVENGEHGIPHGKAREGLTLLETVIAIVIGLVILAGIGVLIYRATSTNKVAEAYSDYATIVTNLRNLYSGTSQTLTTSQATYISAGVFPEHMVYSATLALDPWGGGVYFSSYSTTGLWVMFQSVPKSACIELAQKLTAIAYNGEIDINGRGYVQPTLAQAVTYCNSASNHIGPLVILVGG